MPILMFLIKKKFNDVYKKNPTAIFYKKIVIGNFYFLILTKQNVSFSR